MTTRPSFPTKLPSGLEVIYFGHALTRDEDQIMAGSDATLVLPYDPEIMWLDIASETAEVKSGNTIYKDSSSHGLYTRNGGSSGVVTVIGGNSTEYHDFPTADKPNVVVGVLWFKSQKGMTVLYNPATRMLSFGILDGTSESELTAVTPRITFLNITGTP